MSEKRSEIYDVYENLRGVKHKYGDVAMKHFPGITLKDWEIEERGDNWFALQVKNRQGPVIMYGSSDEISTFFFGIDLALSGYITREVTP